MNENKKAISVLDNNPRRTQIAGWRGAGLTYAEIGRRLGLSKERVRQIDKGVTGPKKSAPKSDLMVMPGVVARMLGIHVNTVRRWADRGILVTYYIGPRGDRRFRKSDIEDLLNNNSSANMTKHSDDS